MSATRFKRSCSWLHTCWCCSYVSPSGRSCPRSWLPAGCLGGCDTREASAGVGRALNRQRPRARPARPLTGLTRLPALSRLTCKPNRSAKKRTEASGACSGRFANRRVFPRRASGPAARQRQPQRPRRGHGARRKNSSPPSSWRRWIHPACAAPCCLSPKGSRVLDQPRHFCRRQTTARRCCRLAFRQTWNRQSALLSFLSAAQREVRSRIS